MTVLFFFMVKNPTVYVFHIFVMYLSVDRHSADSITWQLWIVMSLTWIFKDLGVECWILQACSFWSGIAVSYARPVYSFVHLVFAVVLFWNLHTDFHGGWMYLPSWQWIKDSFSTPAFVAVSLLIITFSMGWDRISMQSSFSWLSAKDVECFFLLFIGYFSFNPWKYLLFIDILIDWLFGFGIFGLQGSLYVSAATLVSSIRIAKIFL